MLKTQMTKTLEEGRNEYTVARQFPTESRDGTGLSDFTVQELVPSRFCGIWPAFDFQDLSFLTSKVE